MKFTPPKASKRRPPPQRNFRAEYQARIAKGLAAGKSRSVSRGHARAEDLGPLPHRPMDRNDPYEKALKALKRGSSLRTTAKEYGMTPERLRRHVKRSTTAQFQRRKWVIFDLRQQEFLIASRGQVRKITLAVDDASDLGRYWRAVNEFLASNDASFLQPFIGRGVRDVSGRYHPFETGPNTLRKLDSVGELNILEIYAEVAK